MSPGRALLSAWGAAALLLVALFAWMRHASQAPANDAGLAPFRIVSDAEHFGPALPRALQVVDGRNGAPPGAGLRCRWIPAHADVDVVTGGAGGCSAEIRFDAGRTRRSRFELDPWMSVDVIVTRDGRRVGIAATRLRFVD